MLEYLHYLIYPISIVLIVLAVGGLNTKHPVVVAASVCSMALNIYAIFAFLWWPIAASLVVDWGSKKVFGDPGAPQS
jgi:ATP/ADP translocase